MNITTSNAYVLLDGLLLEVKLWKVWKKSEVHEEPFHDRYEIFNLHSREKKLEEVKMLSETKETLLDLNKYSLHELINIDSSINVYQAGFSSYIENYVINEKIERYNNEAMILICYYTNQSGKGVERLMLVRAADRE
jgi:hypothetical protein